MTLDPVHVDGIAQLAGQVGRTVETSDQGAVAEDVWENFLDPLWADGTEVLAPLDEQRRRKVPIEDVALEEPPYPTQHGLDSGTINPTTFKNGLVLDVAQAAMSAVPSDVDLHRARTIIMAVHTNDSTVQFDGDWRADDRGFARRRVLEVPQVDRYEQRVVHALALYLAESRHALTNADVVEDLFVLDGPIYPTGLLRWAERDAEWRTYWPRTIGQRPSWATTSSSSNGSSSGTSRWSGSSRTPPRRRSPGPSVARRLLPGSTTPPSSVVCWNGGPTTGTSRGTV